MGTYIEYSASKLNLKTYNAKLLWHWVKFIRLPQNNNSRTKAQFTQLGG